MNAIRARVAESRADDRGMTLVEVVIAITILAILSTASLGVYISGVNSAAAQQRREIAVTVANRVLEDVIATPPASLYSGRSQAAVVALRGLNTTVPGVNRTYDGFQAPPVASTIAAKLTDLVTLSGTQFKVNTIIGTCFQPKIGGSCNAVTTSSYTQPAVPATSVVLTRVIVVVRWSAGSGCGGSGCMYHSSTLIDRNSDLTWNSRD